MMALLLLLVVLVSAPHECISLPPSFPGGGGLKVLLQKDCEDIGLWESDAQICMQAERESLVCVGSFTT